VLAGALQVVALEPRQPLVQAAGLERRRSARLPRVLGRPSSGRCSSSSFSPTSVSSSRARRPAWC